MAEIDLRPTLLGRFWLEGVILTSIAAVGIIGNVLTAIVLKSFDERNHPFNNLVRRMTKK